MPDVPESDFNGRLAQYFSIRYGEDNTTREKYLTTDHDGTEYVLGYADQWVDTGDCVLAVEAANDTDTIREEVGQARSYSRAHPRAIPVVALPESHADYGRFDYWGTTNDVSILPFSMHDPDKPSKVLEWAIQGDTHDPLTSDDPDTVGRAVGLRPMWTNG